MSAKRASLIALVVANLFVALQTVRHDWGYYQTILIFWCEVVILGAFNVLRMLVVGVFGAAPLGSWAARWLDLGSRLNRFVFTVLGVGFFVFKFGGFALIVGILVLLMPAMLTPEGESGARSFHQAMIGAGPGLLPAVAVLCLSHGVSFVRNFLVGREYDRMNIVSLVFWPYARMSFVGVVLAVGLAFGSLVTGMGGQTAFAVVMVLLKLGADAFSHFLEHRWLGTEPESAVPGAAVPGSATG